MPGDTKTGIERSIDRLTDAIREQTRANVFSAALVGILASPDHGGGNGKAVSVAADIAKRAESLGYGNL